VRPFSGRHRYVVRESFKITVPFEHFVRLLARSKEASSHTRSDGCGNQPVIGGWLPQPSVRDGRESQAVGG